MTIRHLKIFVTVCEEGGITQAGHKLFMAQPTVSAAISELEKQYGTKLFDRISRKLYLTDAGQKLLPYARHITSMFDEMENLAHDLEDSGTLKIGTSITIGNRLLTGLLETFAGMHPDTMVKVRIDNSEKIEQAVLNNYIDFGLIEGVAHSPVLISEAFRDDELVLVCSSKHEWAKYKSINPYKLQQESFLMRERGSGAREILESALLLHEVEIEPAWESVSTQAIIQGVIRQHGIAVLPLLLVEEHLAKGELAAVPIEGVSLKRKFSFIYHKDKYLTPAARAFAGICMELK